MKSGYSNCIVAQSGGPTAVINASACGVIQRAMKVPDIHKVYGLRYGIEGILKRQIIDMGQEELKEIEMLKYTPASALGSCRYKLGPTDEDNNEYDKIFKVFDEYNIKYFFYIGGNDSMDTVDKLNNYAREKSIDVKIIGVPKTIDNDLYGTDHTPGYGSAAKYIAASVMEAARDGDVYDKGIINIIEVMGRNAGWLAASSALARMDEVGAPDLIYLPEVKFDMDNFLGDVENKFSKKEKITIVVSEGIKDSNGQYISERQSCEADDFGHVQMGGVNSILGSIVKNQIYDRVKCIELNVLQRCSAHFASKTDVEEAYRCGWEAVEIALAGETGKMVTIDRVSNSPYGVNIGTIDVSMVANNEKKFPACWISKEGNFITEEGEEYIKPLIEGEVFLPMENGLPRFSRLKYKYV